MRKLDCDHDKSAAAFNEVAELEQRATDLLSFIKEPDEDDLLHNARAALLWLDGKPDKLKRKFGRMVRVAVREGTEKCYLP